MPRQVWILADAVAEIEAARVWYEVQRPGLGGEFLGAIEGAVESLLAFPLRLRNPPPPEGRRQQEPR